MAKKPVTPVELPKEVIDLPVEVVEAPVEVAPVLPKPVRKHVVKDGDTYPSIAGLYKPSGVTKHEYSKHLFDLNKGKALTVGTEVAL